MSTRFRCPVCHRLQIRAVVFCHGSTGNKERAPFDEIARKLLSGRIGGCVSSSADTARARMSFRRRPHSTRCRALFLILPGQAVSPMEQRVLAGPFTRRHRSGHDGRPNVGPALIVHGMDDRVVPYTYSNRLHQSWHRHQLVLLPGENHNFTQEADNAADTIAKWFKCIVKRENS